MQWFDNSCKKLKGNLLFDSTVTFALLQFWDLVSTYYVLTKYGALGGSELNPMVKFMMLLTASTVGGVMAAKIISVLLLGIMLLSGRRRILPLVNIFFVILGLSNLRVWLTLAMI